MAGMRQSQAAQRRRCFFLLVMGLMVVYPLWWGVGFPEEVVTPSPKRTRIFRVHETAESVGSDSTDEGGAAKPLRRVQVDEQDAEDSGKESALQSRRAAAEKAASYNKQLFIIWPGALKKKDKIIEDIHKRFEIYVVANWFPDKRTFEEDLWRLYWGKGGIARKGMPLKVRQCGGFGQAVILLVIDHHPKYKTVNTAHGEDFVNQNMHEAKYRYRKWSGGGFKVHGTYSEQESEHDAFVMFGKTATELLADVLHSNKGSVPEGGVLRQLVGTSFAHYTWPSCERLYRGIALVTDAPITPPLAECQRIEEDETRLEDKPDLVVMSTGIPKHYDHSIDVHAAIVALVHGRLPPKSTTSEIVGHIQAPVEKDVEPIPPLVFSFSLRV